MKQDEKQLQSKGIWDQWTANKYHQSSPRLAIFLSQYLSIRKPVIDFGCGNAYYCGELAAIGFKCTGVEGYKLNSFFHDDIIIQDLSKSFWLGLKGQVLSLEVGEHIEREYEQTFLDNITEHCDSKLVLSWALPGQPGIGHINCRSQEYIIDEVERRGFSYNTFDSMEIRKHIDDHCDWFRRTLMIFDRE